MFKKIILILVFHALCTCIAYSYENFELPDSLPSIINANNLNLRLRKYVETGEALSTSFERVLSEYKGALNLFVDYQSSCLAIGIPLKIKKGSLFDELEATCSLNSLRRVKDRLAKMGSRLDDLENKLMEVKIKMSFAEKHIIALERSTDFFEME